MDDVKGQNTGMLQAERFRTFCQNVTTTVLIRWSLYDRHGLSLHGLKYPGYEPYRCFDHIWDMASMCTQRNMVIYIPVYNQVLVSDGFCIFFVHVPAIFFCL